MRLRNSQSGSVIVLVAVAMLVLIAFAGLVVDGGQITSQVRASQNAADGAALAAAYEVAENGQSISSATTIANLVAAKNGIPTSDLTLTYLDSSRNVTTSAASVNYIDTNVTHTFPTLFLPLINIDSATAKASAEVKVVQDSGMCVICALDGSASQALNVTGNVSITGGSTWVNSASSTAMTATATYTDASGINVVGGFTGGSYISPTPATGVSPTSDPLSAIPEPTLSSYAGCPVKTITGPTPGGGAVGWPPGIYNGFSASGSATYVFDGAGSGWCGIRGVFVFIGDVNLSGNATFSEQNGAMIFLTCASFPTSYCSGSTDPLASCATPATGARLLLTGSSQATLSPSPGYGGTYAGMAIFADRCNNGGGGTNYVISLSGTGTSSPACLGSSSCLKGTLYASAGNVTIGGNESWTVDSRMVADTLKFVDSFTDTFSVNANYSPDPKLLLVK